MKNEINQLSQYIDELNAGKESLEYDRKNKVEDHNKKVKVENYNKEVKTEDYNKEVKAEEYHKLTSTVKRIHFGREIEYPDELYPQRLINSLIKENTKKIEKSNPIRLRRVLIASATIAAIFILFITVNKVFFTENTNIVYAMERALQEISAYHGIIEVTETNELGETMTQSKREVWADLKGNYYINELEGYSKGLVTVNNSQKKWQIRPEDKEISIFATFPDPYRFTFELGNELDSIKSALTVKVIGNERISGRDSTKLEITPKGGTTYYLWVDQETDLPLQKQSAMQNAMQYRICYTSIDFIEEIPKKLLTYPQLEGYSIIDSNPEQVVATLDEAYSILGFSPNLAENLPEGYTLDMITTLKNQSAVKLYYNSKDISKKVVIMQSKVSGDLKPDSRAVLGTVNNNQAEVMISSPTSSIRWQEKGMEYNVIGNVTSKELIELAEGLSEGEAILPTSEADNSKLPQINVDVDLAVEENEQKSVDAGHSPWKLDPTFVAQVFASLLLSPEGIVGDYPIAYENITIISNNGSEAVAEIKDEDSIAKFVYLKRLVRQDDTGIWSVVGYDLQN